MSETVDIEGVDHIGIRVRDLDRALAFYRVLRFALARRATGDDVAIVRNPQGVEIDLIFNADAGDPAENILMDVGRKYPDYTHVALRVASIPQMIAALAANRIAIHARAGADGPGRERLGVRPRSRPQRHRAARSRPGRDPGLVALRPVTAAEVRRANPPER